MTISGHFSTNYMFIFHKTEVQTVILMCCQSLNLNWYKIYGTKSKKTKKPIELFFTKSQKTGNGNIFILCHKFGSRSIKHLKLTLWTSVLWKMNLHMAKKWPERVVKQSFLSNIRFRSVFMFSLSEKLWF